MKQLLCGDFAVEMHQTVPIPGHVPQKPGIAFSQYADFSKLKGNILVFDDRTAETFRKEMPA